MSGACVRRARFAAADGRPMPTKQTQPSHSSRAAATVIISSRVQRHRAAHRARLRRQASAGTPRGRGCRARGARSRRVKRRAVARDLVPGEVEGVVARVVALRVGRLGAARHAARRRSPPSAAARSAFIGASSSSTISSTVTSSTRAASAASFCAPTMPRSRTLPARSAFCACRIVTSGLSAGTVASASPVYGQVTLRICGLTRAQVGADVAAQHRRTAGARRRRV